MSIEFRLLGEVEVVVDGKAVDVGHARQRCVLAVLLIDANRVVPADQLLDRVWAGDLPQRARATLSSYISRLRRVLGLDIRSHSGGYVLDADPLTIDLFRFRDLVVRARAATAPGAADPRAATDSGAAADPRAAADLLGEALGLWRGPVLLPLDTPWIAGVRESLGAERLAAQLDHNDLLLAAGGHAVAVGALLQAAEAHPVDERLAGQLMLALYRCGRQAEALQHYERLRLRLAEELGIDPSPPLRLLHKQILTADTAPAWPGTASREPAGSRPVPRQLPAPPRTFSGRIAYLDRLDGMLPSTSDRAPVIAAVSGAPGVGKTALALHWAGRRSSRFPDGQLYVNLRGFEPRQRVMGAAEAVRGFLDALGVAPQRVPSQLDEQAALYRSLVADRQLLMVLDNARDAEQVRPLLPGAPGCMALVTSRNQLTGLIANEGAYPVLLDLLADDEARELLGRHLGSSRPAAEPGAVDQITAGCGGLPLALSIVAARAATRPGLPLAVLADELRDTHGRLDVLADGDAATDVRAAFALSYQALSEPAARLFRLIGLHPGPEVSAAAAACLTGEPVRRSLTELTQANLLDEPVPGRYTVHDLLHAFAFEQAQAGEGEAERTAAIRRLLDHYLRVAYGAAMAVEPDRDPITLQVGEAVELEGIDAAFAWFTTEHQVLLAMIRWAAGTGFDTHAWQLAWTLTTYLNRRAHWFDWADTHETALAAATRLGDRPALAYVHRSLGRAYARLGRGDSALHHFRQALDLFGGLGDHAGQARTHIALSWLYERQQLYAEALAHDEQALSLYRRSGHRLGIAASLNNVGWHHAHLGRYRQALASCRQALALHREIHSEHGEADTLGSIGFIHQRQGDHAGAVEFYELARSKQNEIGSRVAEAETLVRLGEAQREAGDGETALGSWRAALAIFEELEHPGAEDLRARLGAFSRPAAPGR